MHLQTSREVFESEIRARLVGRMLGIVYWIINITYLIKESLIIVEYYFRYLLSQDTSTATQIQVVETVLSCLVVAVITIFFALDTIVLMCITFRQEKSLLKPHLCELSEKEMAKDKVEPSCPCWLCMAKDHVKECLPAKPVVQMNKVKAIFLNLEKDKNKNKTAATATKKDQ